MFKQKLSRKFKFMTDYLRFQEFTKLQLYISENFIFKILCTLGESPAPRALQTILFVLCL